jgi:hypothetical protein
MGHQPGHDISGRKGPIRGRTIPTSFGPMPSSGAGGATGSGQAGSGPNTINYSTGATAINFTTAFTASSSIYSNMPGVQKRPQPGSMKLNSS